MSNRTIELTEEYARCILGMMVACFSEGLGPDDDEFYILLGWILTDYPHLKDDRAFGAVQWDRAIIQNKEAPQ